MVAIGNPPADNEGSWFEDLCSADDVHTIPISALSTPNFTGEKVARCRSCPPEAPKHTLAKHLVKRQFVEDIAKEFGEDSPYYQAKVLARFPRGGSLRIIPSQWAEDAVNADEPDRARVRGWTTWACRTSRAAGGQARRVDPAWCRRRQRGRRRVRHLPRRRRPRHHRAQVLRVPRTPTPHRGRGDPGADQAGAAAAGALGTRAPVRVKIDAIGLGWGPSASSRRGGPRACTTPRSSASTSPRAPAGRTRRSRRCARLLKRDEMWIAMRHLLQPQRERGLPGMLRLRIDRRTMAQLTMPPGTGRTPRARSRSRARRTSRSGSRSHRTALRRCCWRTTSRCVPEEGGGVPRLIV
jgi:hypothetical protein